MGPRLGNSTSLIEQHMGRVLKVGRVRMLVIKVLILYLQQTCLVSCKLRFPLFLLNPSSLSKEKILVCMNIVFVLLMKVHHPLEGRFIHWMNMS